MSDFIFASIRHKPGILANLLTKYGTKCPESDVFESHGTWGSLATKRNHYQGYQHYEDSEHLCVVVGGPLIRSTCIKSIPLTTKPENHNTHTLLSLWKLGNLNTWHSEVSGPFAILVIDKRDGGASLVTDMMGFITVFWSSIGGVDQAGTVVGTQINTVSIACGRQDDLDKTSVCEFVTIGTVTYPYTVFRDVYQASTSSVTLFARNESPRVSRYWRPDEKQTYKSLNEAAEHLRSELCENIVRSCDGKERIGVMLSGGEDSRTVLAATLQSIKPTAITYSYGWNREAKLAKRVADIAGVEWRLWQKERSEYIKDFDERCRLAGSHESVNQLALFGIPKEVGLRSFDAVLGGMWSDGLIKGIMIKQRHSKIHGVKYLPSRIQDLTVEEAVESVRGYWAGQNGLSSAVINEDIAERRIAHYMLIREFRPRSADEWRTIWPFANHPDAAPFQSNRRTFVVYEPFSEVNIVKLASEVPLEWKINRRLLQAATAPILGRLGWIPHPECYLPALKDPLNIPIGLCVGVLRHAGRLLGIGATLRTEPWKAVVKGEEFENLRRIGFASFGVVSDVFSLEYQKLFEENALSPLQQIRLLQVLTLLEKGPVH